MIVRNCVTAIRIANAILQLDVGAPHPYTLRSTAYKRDTRYVYKTIYNAAFAVS